LRVDALNLKNFVYDTNDISTIRGGSFILMEAIKSLRDKFKNELDAISTAASMGTFLVKKDDPTKSDLQEIESEVLKHLANYCEEHATFVLAIEPEAKEGFAMTLQKLEAQIHRQQWRLPTVAIPEAGNTDSECHVDGWRPGVEEYRVDPAVTNAKMSAATCHRRKLGRRLKHNLLPSLVGQEDGFDEKKDICTKDLGKLSQHTGKGILNGKIAFIHADGNSFGKIRNDKCHSRGDRTKFDEIIKTDFHAHFLEILLERARSEADFKTEDEYGQEALRLEVLLWGGDEMTLIVPAWKAWQTVELFFEKSKHLTFNKVPLTHRMAVIFCHHNAPILQIRQLAEKLLTQTKQDTKSFASHAEGDALHYLALESFDMLQGEFEDFLKRYYRKINYEKLLLHATDLGTIKEVLQLFHQNVARSKLFKLISALQSDRVSEMEKIKEKIIAEVKERIDDLWKDETETQLKKLEAVDEFTENHPACWYVVADLWDYISEWK